MTVLNDFLGWMKIIRKKDKQVTVAKIRNLSSGYVFV